MKRFFVNFPEVGFHGIARRLYYFFLFQQSPANGVYSRQISRLIHAGWFLQGRNVSRYLITEPLGYIMEPVMGNSIKPTD